MNKLNREVFEIGSKALNIAIPKPDPENWRIGWVIRPNCEFVDFHIVKAQEAPGKFVFITRDFNFRFIDVFMRRDPKASKKLSDAFIRNYFGGAEATKERCESFFSNNDNFIWPGGVKGLLVLDQPQERHVWAGQR